MKKLLSLLIIAMLLFIPTLSLAEKNSLGSDGVADSDSSSSVESDTVSANGNLIVNGTFEEQGSLSGWEFEGFIQDDSHMEWATDEKQGGCLYLVCPSLNDVRAYQIISVEPNSYYSITCVVRTQDVEEGNGANISVTDSYAYSDVLYGTNDWTKLTLTGLTDTNQTELKIALRIGGYSADSKGEAWFDDVVVEKLDTRPADCQNLFMTVNNDQAEVEDDTEAAAGDSEISSVIAFIVVLCLFMVLIYNWFFAKGKRKADNKMHTGEDGLLLRRTDTRLHFKRIDAILLATLMIVYTAIAFINIGTTQAPSNAWVSSGEVDAAVIHLDCGTTVGAVYVYNGGTTGGSIVIADENDNKVCAFAQTEENCNGWAKIDCEPFDAENVKVTPVAGDIDIAEMVFYDTDGKIITTAANKKGLALVDESDLMPETLPIEKTEQGEADTEAVDNTEDPFISLFDGKTPQSPWEARPSVVCFDGDVTVNGTYIFGGIAENNTDSGVVFYDDEGKELFSYRQLYWDMYRWKEVHKTPYTTSSVTVISDFTTTSEKLDFKELAFLDSQGNPISGTTSKGAEALMDEQHEIPEEFSYLNCMYFDEVYHGRTAYEHLYGLDSYENSHPPLGKIIISLGISLFGMNAFGWRIMGVLFGIGMIPILYCFAKYIFKRSSFAFITTVLFSFDFMHFTQTRIATIDVYGVFFILLMFYYMYKYFTMSFYRDGLKDTLVPLGCAGIFFGLGIASKWICFYAGAGLAVMLFLSIAKRFIEYLTYRNSANEMYRRAVKDFWRNTFVTVLFCVVFFIVIPGIIYSATYLVYPDVVGEFTTAYESDGLFAGIKAYLGRVWHYQDFMFSYHSDLVATHTYQSTWYEWMFDLRPIWYSINYFDNSMVSTISAMGNPIVWWLAVAGTVGFVIQTLRGKIESKETVALVLVGILSNLTPWMIISRCAFIYHYFATVPFIIIGAMYFLKSLEKEFGWMTYFKWLWMGAALLLFGIFYPVISGMKIHESYALSLEWIESWWFVRNAAAPTNDGTINGIIIMSAICLVFVVAGCVSYDLWKKNKLPKFLQVGEDPVYETKPGKAVSEDANEHKKARAKRKAAKQQKKKEGNADE